MATECELAAVATPRKWHDGHILRRSSRCGCRGSAGFGGRCELRIAWYVNEAGVNKNSSCMWLTTSAAGLTLGHRHPAARALTGYGPAGACIAQFPLARRMLRRCSACVKQQPHRSSRGLRQWEPAEVTVDEVRKQVQAGEWYVLRDGGRCGSGDAHLGRILGRQRSSRCRNA
jgi:hypothetical protein